MGIVALGMAVAYLLLVATGAIGALLIVLWLFRDTPGTTEKKVGRGEVEGSRSAEHLGPRGTYSASVEPVRREDEAA